MHRLIVILCAFSAVSAYAVPLTPLAELPDSEYPLMDTVKRKAGEQAELSLLPDVSGAAGLRARYSAYKPEITVQKLYRFPLARRTTNRELFLMVANSLGRPETQVGYTYHSATKDDDVVLFKDSYISDAKGKRASPFSYHAGNLPGKISYFQFVNEANFSGTVLKQEIEIGEDYLSFRSTNMERMWYAIIPILKAEGTRSEMLFFLHGEHLYVYSATQLEEDPSNRKLPVKLHIPSMFGKRMDVLAQWMEDQLRERMK